ncbi:MAG: tRNA (adenosine(37)-N6)-threonylcarbamoyltransferase complex dimerization subunit type 1 TsaB [Deltaproteobacteria bacterium]|nr:tRNA (adenosine(37)-N6)-threonylcarbamoyltransferase complex dimerization subunit type 1 TsaB [Deltaproteobacteria bacterium]
MITLAMECATDTVGVALLKGEEIMADFYLGPGRHHAEVLLPVLEKLLLLTGITLEKIDLLACTAGPGSFTGVRIGVSTVKGLALATGRPIVSVSTLEALTMNAFPSPGLICPLLDARRDQVYAGLYRMGPDGFPEIVTPDRLTEIAQLMRDLPVGEVELIGDGALRYRDRILEARSGRCDPAGSGRHRLHASAVGLIGIHRYSQGRGEDPLTFSPRYLRLSEAEARGA